MRGAESGLNGARDPSDLTRVMPAWGSGFDQAQYEISGRAQAAFFVRRLIVVRIKVNEVVHEFTEPPKLMELRARFKPDADLVIHNGFPSVENVAVSDGDSVVFIRKGEKPGMDELEALMSARHTPGVHDKVKAATVGIAGLGGLGSPVAIALARVGVGTLVLADYDVVEPSNLNRQQYFVDQIGRPKVAAMEENLRRINPFVRTVTHNAMLDDANIPELFGGVDVLVEALDDAGAKAMLVNVMAKERPNTPVVCASGVAGYGPSNDITTRRFSGACYIVGDLTSEAASGTGLMAPRVGVAAHHQANCVLRILLGEEPVKDAQEEEGKN
jgi:sulfur carrier protein ThiS adenylyltransferase